MVIEAPAGAFHSSKSPNQPPEHKLELNPSIQGNSINNIKFLTDKNDLH